MTARAKLPQFVRYPAHSEFRRELVERVDAYFDEQGISRKGNAGMVCKSAILLAWFVGSYALLVFWASAWWHVGALVVSMGLAIAGIGFSIGHDGVHGAYSESRLGTRLAGLTFDLVGASSYFWHYKHDVLHHQFTNIDSLDQDIEAEPFLRLSPGQELRWYHRFQHLYAGLIYGWLVVKWHFFDDFAAYVTGRIGSRRIPRPRGRDLLAFVGGKLWFFGLAFGLPALLHPLPVIVLVYLLCTLVAGITLSTVFQLAHVVDGTSFWRVPEVGGRMRLGWAEHQLATTADFCPTNRLLRWYVGGLNYQVEHHLFARVCHVHYPALQVIVREVCGRHGIPHHVNPTLWGAIRAHLRLLRRLGRETSPSLGPRWFEESPAPAA